MYHLYADKLNNEFQVSFIRDKGFPLQNIKYCVQLY